eukprot:CAMPEP_0182531824 /NCGR_PEP_ID=MMETSP1323-20130603/10177_1 /TAXON_ID=236787 /ORGANISM="Florenciella parvula, Strain RCC1693" /LENGTH=76 /DNA_ID=CAMNT_0024741461 /DNA_START=75 /DNA_END=305 /DNA_ORIENTATION=-
MSEADSQEWVGIVCFECRGMEPIGYTPKNDFAVETTGGTIFDCEDVEFDEGMWADYDGENDMSVSIQDLEIQFETF